MLFWVVLMATFVGHMPAMVLQPAKFVMVLLAEHKFGTRYLNYVSQPAR